MIYLKERTKLGLSPEKMEELKKKYNIGDEAIFEIADSLEPESEAPEPLPVGRGKTTEALPASLIAATQGSISMPEVIMYMDYQDRRDEKKERRYGTTQPSQDTSNIDKIINEMREERKTHQDQMERLILGKRADDAEERAKRAEEDLKKKEETDRQREIVEGAVQGAVGEISQKYDTQFESLAQRVSLLPANQQTSFMDELFTDFGTSLKDEFKTMILNRLKPADKPLTKTDEEGKKSIDIEALLNRGAGLVDKYIDTLKGKPPKLPVEEIRTQPGGAPGPLEEGPPKAAEGLPPEAQPEKPEAPAVATPPIPPQDLEGIGPERAKKLSELGINDARQLAKISPGYLKDQLGVGKEKAEDIIKQAKELAEKT